MPKPTQTVSPELGATLRAAREGAGVTRRALCRQAGIDHTHVAKFEKGERPISTNAYAHLLAALAVLLDGDAA